LRSSDSILPRIWLLSLLGSLFAGCGQASPSEPSACPDDTQSGCPATALTYDTGIGALIGERCSPCHAPGGVEASRVLTDYAHASGLKMSIATQLVSCSMPPLGAPQLSSDERQQILDWLSCGGPR
jgi:cytochrome c5